MTRPLRYLSVCSGIEAATVAWHPLGWEPAGFSEIDPFARAVLQHHYPQVPLHGDFTTIKGDEYGSVDVLVGGTPCQDFSVAGLRAGLAGDRGNLTLEFLRLAGRLRPAWIVWENVPGVLSLDKGRAFGAVLGGLAQLGYGFAYRILDAQYFGLAQRRERVFVVGHLGDWRRAAAVLFERESLQGHPAPRREAGEGIARPITPGSPGGSGYRNDAATADNLIAGTLDGCGGAADENDAKDGRLVVPPIDASFGRLQGCSGQDLNHGHSHLIAFGGNNTAGPIDVATAVNAHGRLDFESETFVAHSLRAEGFDASEDGTGRGTLLIAFSAKDHGADAGDIAPTRRAAGFDKSHANGGVMPAVAFDARQSDVIQYGNRTGPLDTDGHTMVVAPYDDPRRFDARGIHGGFEHGEVHPPLNTVNSQQILRQAMQVRRLTPRECERLMGFPDDYTLVPWRNGMAPDGPRYKALGNSMAVPVMRWIGQRIALVEALGALP